MSPIKETMNHYSETIRQWATDTRRTGQLPNADGTGEVGLQNGEVGRRLAARFTLKVEHNHVVDVRYQVFGCGFSMAACAVAADMVVGYDLDEVQKIDSRSLDNALKGLPPDRGYCADLAVEALHAAIRSVRSGRLAEASYSEETDHGARVTFDDPRYRTLMKSPVPQGVSGEDRHLFACLLTVAAQESHEIATPLGLEESDVDSILQRFFPEMTRSDVEGLAVESPVPGPERSPELLSMIRTHLPQDGDESSLFLSQCLTKIITVRSALPGHLWVAMGLTERPQLTSAIRRHLPSLAKANSQNMRWKRFLFKQLCDLNGGVMCKAPNCGVCSDYHLCFESV